MRIIAPSFYARAKPVSISIFNSDDGLDLYASKPDPRRLKTESRSKNLLSRVNRM